MNTRVLEPSEWHRVQDLDVGELLQFVRTEDVKVVVVEHEDEIIASWTIMRMVHLEGVWVHPQHKNAGVVRSLIRKTKEEAAEWSSAWVVTSAASDAVRAILSRMHAKKVEADMYTLALDQFGGN